jgi:hypothetical protein
VNLAIFWHVTGSFFFSFYLSTIFLFDIGTLLTVSEKYGFSSLTESHLIEVPSKESERSCICAFGV